MKNVLAAALAAALMLPGCRRHHDDVTPPEDKPLAHGACVDAAGGHRLCGGAISAGGSASIAAGGGHVVGRSAVGGDAVPQVSTSQYQITRGAVSP